MPKDNENNMNYSKVAQALEKVFPLINGKEYYLSTQEFKVAFQALADTIKTLRTVNKDATKQIEKLVSDVISTHKAIENKADESITLSDKVLNNYNDAVTSLKDELSKFKDDIQNKIDSVKDGEDAKPEDVVTLVLEQIKFPETVLDEGAEIKTKLEKLQGDDRLDASAIKDLPEAINTGVRGVRTKVHTDGTSITGDGTLANPLVGGSSGATTFVALTDTPANYTGAASKAIKVKADESGLEFVTLISGGDMVLADVQSVTGKKTFDTTKLAVKGSSTGVTTIASANTSATDYTHTLPAKTGTVAMTSDVNAGTVTSVTSANTDATVATTTTTPVITIVSAPKLTTARTIGGTSFDGTANIAVALAATVTTNADLTGPVTSTGNATAIADAALSIAKTSGLQSALDLKAPLASPTFTGTVTVPTPSNATDAVPKAYADAITQSLDIKQSVRVASTADIAIASALINASTIDGVAVATGDRVLLKNQTAGAENGIYIVAASGAASRSTDADTSAKVTSGMYVFVSEGTVSADMGYVLTTNDPITLGTTALAFTQFSGAGQIVAGAGLTKTGNTLDVIGTANRIVVSADAIDIGTNVVTLAGAQTLTDKTLTSPVVNTPTGIVKGDVGLGNVDNTSNETERAAEATLTNKTLVLGGDIDTNNKNITRKAIPAGDVTGEGDIVTDIVAGEAVAFGNVVYLKSDGKFWKASNAGIATAGLLGIALESKNADEAVKVLLRGFLRDDVYTMTVAGQLYLGTAGGIVQTIPTAVDTVVQVVGYATHANRMFFCPSMDTMTRLVA